MKKIAKCLLSLLILTIIVIIGVILYIVFTIRAIRDPEILSLSSFNLYNNQYEIYDTDNNLMSTNSKNGQATLKLSDLPKYVPQAFVSIEDKNFFNHNGLNYGRIIKAGFNNLFAGYAKEGASTITQQLIKNIYLSNEKTLSRKIQEAYLATKLEDKHSKEEILETYLNVIYFGNGAYGIENASNVYFNKSARNLTLSESATLAGIIKSPKSYSPTGNPKNCLSRRNLVLKNMLADGKISNKEFENALKQKLSVNSGVSTNYNYTETVLQEASQILNKSELDISRSGYKIYTNLNKILQKQISNLDANDKENAIIVIDNTSGKILATHGNIMQKRQPASTIKPFVAYAPNFEKGTLSPITPVLDSKTNFGSFCPSNANGKFLGWTDVDTALSLSLNIPAVKALDSTDINYAVSLAQNCGFNLTDEDKNLAVALGATQYGTPILNVAKAYSSLANLGTMKNISLINKITDHEGNEVFVNTFSEHSVMSKETAYLLNGILQNCVKDGTAKKLGYVGLNNISAKTGTFGIKNGTNTDAWCISYNPDFTVLTWFGNSSGDEEKNLSKNENGGTISARQNAKIWTLIINNYSKTRNLTRNFNRPENIAEYSLDSISYGRQKIELASPNTPERYKKTALFNSKFAPDKISSNFEIITLPSIELEKTKECLSLSWEAVDIYNYDVVAKTDSSEKLLKTVSGKNQTISCFFSIPTETTEYYLRVKSKFNPDLVDKSNSKRFYISRKKI